MILKLLLFYYSVKRLQKYIAFSYIYSLSSITVPMKPRMKQIKIEYLKLRERERERIIISWWLEQSTNKVKCEWTRISF